MATGPLAGLKDPHLERLMEFSRQVNFPAGSRLFEEGGRADHFWIIRSGSVDLSLHIPGRAAPRVETLGPGELLGWSWLFPPYRWHFGAQALSPVRALEFDAERVRQLCREDPALGHDLVLACAQVIADRLKSARTRLLDLYGPHRSYRDDGD
ncbi:cyclic nucleotide-binding domain-containing protein [Wenjunlia tyrosinilytica]|nr:cyclic nucleotide-binding domain-containing protein [Wenjunlia tyrosinilytica]